MFRRSFLRACVAMLAAPVAVFTERHAVYDAATNSVKFRSDHLVKITLDDLGKMKFTDIVAQYQKTLAMRSILRRGDR